MINKLNKMIDILKKATEILTYIVTGYSKTKEAAERISLAFVKVFRVILFFVFGGIVALVVKKIIDKKRKNAELASAENINLKED